MELILGFLKIQNIRSTGTKILQDVTECQNSTPNYMGYGERGRYPTSISIKKRMISFWFNLLTSCQSKIKKNLYVNLLNRRKTCEWLTYNF